MGAYVLRRLLLMVPTILGIMAISFAVIQFAPGGPVEQVIAQLTGQGGDATERITGGSGDFGGQDDFSTSVESGSEITSKYRGAQGLDPEFIADLERQFGFDKPPLQRFGQMIWNYTRFDFGESYFRDISVIDLILEKMPVSISLGIWITLISYGISIPLGIRKAIRDGSAFDVWTSGVIIVDVTSCLFTISTATCCGSQLRNFCYKNNRNEPIKTGLYGTVGRLSELSTELFTAHFVTAAVVGDGGSSVCTTMASTSLSVRVKKTRFTRRKEHDPLLPLCRVNSQNLVNSYVFLKNLPMFRI